MPQKKSSLYDIGQENEGMQHQLRMPLGCNLSWQVDKIARFISFLLLFVPLVPQTTSIGGSSTIVVSSLAIPANTLSGASMRRWVMLCAPFGCSVLSIFDLTRVGTYRAASVIEDSYIYSIVQFVL